MSTFNFHSLSAEIRCMIWKHTWEPRGVVIRRICDLCEPVCPHDCSPYNWHDNRPILNLKNVWKAACPNATTNRTFTKSKMPVSLLVNRESRSETQLHYKLAFKLPQGESRVYFNFALDVPIVLQDDLPIWRLETGGDFAGLHNLVILKDREQSGMPWLSFPILGTSSDTQAQSSMTSRQSHWRVVDLIVLICPGIKHLDIASSQTFTPDERHWAFCSAGLALRRIDSRWRMTLCEPAVRKLKPKLSWS